MRLLPIELRLRGLSREIRLDDRSRSDLLHLRLACMSTCTIRSGITSCRDSIHGLGILALGHGTLILLVLRLWDSVICRCCLFSLYVGFMPSRCLF